MDLQEAIDKLDANAAEYYKNGSSDTLYRIDARAILSELLAEKPSALLNPVEAVKLLNESDFCHFQERINTYQNWKDAGLVEVSDD